MQTKQNVRQSKTKPDKGKVYHQLAACPACHEHGTLEKTGEYVRCVNCERSWSTKALHALALKYGKKK